MSDILDLFDLDQRAYAGDAITTALLAAAQRDGVQTDADTRQRFRIAYELLKIMRFDLRWSWSRIRDELPTALRSELDGVRWTPSPRASWYASAR